MTDNNKTAIVVDPEHGQLPAYRILDCIFALAPSGGILHRHIEEFSADENGSVIVYSECGKQPDDSRARCQIIPPRIPQFPKLD